MRPFAHNWPLMNLRLTTPDLELRVPTPRMTEELAQVAQHGIHDPSVQPFGNAWTDGADSGYRVQQWARAKRYGWQPENWTCVLAAVYQGRPVGVQAVAGRDFRVLREVATGSWLGLAWQNKGLGTEMRAAALHLAFAGLDAQYATTSAHADNPASLAITRKLGYIPDGIDRRVVRGHAVAAQRFRLDRAGWAAHRTVPVGIDGLEDCLPWFLDQEDT